MNRLPIYKLTIDIDADGMDYMGLVDQPAHGKGWASFSKLKKAKQIKSHFNEEKRIVSGVAIATNLQIYRRTSAGFEYNAIFTKEDTKQIAIKLAENGYMNNVNEMHDLNKDVSDMALFESYFIEDDKRNIPDSFADQNLQPGSWIVSYKVNNDDVWEKIKNGEFYGFSIEGWFKEVEVSIKQQEMKKAHAKIKGKYATIQEISKWDIEVFEDDLTIGTELHYKWEDWDGVVEVGGRIEDGEYSWDGHKIQVDSNGIIVMIDGQTENVTLRKSKKSKNTKMKKKSLMQLLGFAKAKPEGEEPLKFDKDKHGQATTVDGVEVMWEGDAPVEGESLFIMDADNEEEMILADAGEYAFDVDGVSMVATVDEAGLITSLVEAEEGDDTGEALQAMKKDYETKLSAQKKAFDSQLKVIGEQFDKLSEAVDLLADPKKGKKKHSSENKPNWRRK